jgi:hypothetical protein
MKRKTSLSTDDPARSWLLILLVVCSAIAAWGVPFYAASNRPSGGYPDGLMQYQTETIRARRIEIMDEEWRIRIVMTVHDGTPAVVFYDENGEAVEATMAIKQGP